jgi:hypothetical protein
VKLPCLESEVQHATDKLCESALILLHRYDLIKTAFLDAGWCSTHTVNFLGLLAALSNENTHEHIMVALVWFASVGLNAAQLTAISRDGMWSAFAENRYQNAVQLIEESGYFRRGRYPRPNGVFSQIGFPNLFKERGRR